MERVEIESRLRGIFQRLFHLDPTKLSGLSSPDSIPGWDSLQHLNVVTSIEQEFGLSLEPDQVVEMLTFGVIIDVLERLVGTGPSPAFVV